MKVKVLGTQSPYATGTHNCPGFLITEGDSKIMLDCGSGSHRLLNLPEDLEGLHVFISHFHRDHYNDIYNLQYASFVFHNQKRLKNPICIHMPMTPADIHRDISEEKYAYADYKTILNEYKGVKIGGLKVSFCLTDHTNESYAIKVESETRSVVYTSDISFASKSKIIAFAEDADLLICESSFLESYGFDENTSHLTAMQAATIAKRAKVKRLMLTHFWPEESLDKFIYEATTVFSDGIIAAKEGDVIDISGIDVLPDVVVKKEKEFNPSLWNPLGVKGVPIPKYSTSTGHNGFVEYQAPEDRYEVRGIMPKAPKNE